MSAILFNKLTLYKITAVIIGIKVHNVNTILPNLCSPSFLRNPLRSK
jgi:hypothetical protein